MKRFNKFITKYGIFIHLLYVLVFISVSKMLNNTFIILGIIWTIGGIFYIGFKIIKEDDAFYTKGEKQWTPQETNKFPMEQMEK